MSKLMASTLPEDFDFTLEDSGKQLDLLHIRIVWKSCPTGARGTLRVLPQHVNIADVVPGGRLTQSRDPHFLDELTTPKSMLRRLLHPHIHQQNGLLAHKVVDAITHFSVLPLETHLVGWPNRTPSAALLSVSSRHDSTLLGFCRRFGRFLRSPHSSTDLWSLARQLATDVLPLYL